MSQPIALQVSNSANGASGSPQSSLPPPNMQSSPADDTASADGGPAFLRVLMPKRELYLGELLPVEVKAYFRAGMSASLNGLPILDSDAFTLNKLDENPNQSQEIVGGRPYTVLTWSSALAAVKTGDYTINLELPVVVRVQEHNQGDDDSPFNEPFFSNFFGNVVKKPLTLRTDLQNVKVLPLPAAGRPVNFTGAVGQFGVNSQATPIHLNAGDPITLQLQVSGQGNFDRVYSSGLETSAAWKTYPPSTQFVPADNAGYSGSKTFEQAVIPLKTGQKIIPAITFSYFDPDTRQYVTRVTTPIAIKVAPGDAASSVAALPASPAASTSTPLTNLAASDLAPNKVETGSFVSSLSPVLFAPWFIAVQGVPFAALFAGLFVHRRRQRLAQDPERKRNRAAHAAIREQLLAMDQALTANSAPSFFSAARQAVQERLALRWQLSSSQVTPAVIKRHLNGDANALQALFAVTDDVVYSGRSMPSAELQRWKDTVIQQLKELEAL